MFVFVVHVCVCLPMYVRVFVCLCVYERERGSLCEPPQISLIQISQSTRGRGRSPSAVQYLHSISLALNPYYCLAAAMRARQYFYSGLCRAQSPPHSMETQIMPETQRVSTDNDKHACVWGQLY